MAIFKNFAAIQKCIVNRLEDSALDEKSIAGVIGDAPSHYSRSPRLWNAAFDDLGIHAVYLPFDVDDAHVGNLLAALKDTARFIGVNVTVPYKVRVMDYIDELDAGAQRIQAVNTIVRSRSGRLIGYNTDGEGFIESILTRQPGRAESFLSSLKEMTVLLLGAGGSARAVAFHVSDLLEGGQLVICNRTLQHAMSLAADLQKTRCHPLGISEKELAAWAPKAGCIINCTTKGQSGVRKLPNGMAVTLEPYSALAPAHPPALAESISQEQNTRLPATAAADIDANNSVSMALARSVPPETRFYDLIYHPEETIFLRQGRITGHPTMNGKGMIVNQATIAFKLICNAELQARNIDNAQTHKQILEIMYRAW
ncbi:MAG TPA: shikimate dehydrogenase [Verrucomicrobiae bacterium]|nr:shikimate dehydrogenase [Verrucomicrobiae bacterium]